MHSERPESKQQIIAFDVDGVLTDFTYGFTSVARSLGIVSEPWSGDQQPNWHFPFYAAPVWTAIESMPNWWMTLRPLVSPAEVRRLNNYLQSGNHRALFLTNRTDKRTHGSLPVGTQTTYWLQAQGIDMRYAQVITTKNKAATAKSLDVTVAFEDGPENLLGYTELGIPVVRRAWPYNKDFGHIRSCTSLNGFLDYLLGAAI